MTKGFAKIENKIKQKTPITRIIVFKTQSLKPRPTQEKNIVKWSFFKKRLFNPLGSSKNENLPTPPLPAKLNLREYINIVTKYVEQLGPQYNFQNLSWQTVATKFNLYRRYDSIASKPLKNWYLAKQESQNLTFSNRKLYLEWQVKKGGHRNYKKRDSSELQLNDYQAKIIKFVESQKKSFSDFSWTSIAQKFDLYEYFDTQSTLWQELKEWFNLESEKTKKNRLMNQDVQHYIDPDTGLFEFSMNRKIQSLAEWVTELFNVTKTKLFITENLETIAYYKSFFESLHPPDFNQIELFEATRVREICNDFENNVTNQETMIAYLKRIPGLYVRLCLWCVYNPYKDLRLKYDHHVLPKFLTTSYGYSIKAIETKHNLITIDWAVHFILHVVRLIEYGQPQDKEAVGVLLSIKGISNIRIDSRLRVVSLCNWLNEYFVESFWEASPDFAEKNRQRIEKAVIASSSKRMSPVTLNILAKKTVWIHQKYKDENGLPFTVTMASQKHEKYYSVQSWIQNLLFTLPIRDSQRVKYLNPENKNRALNLFQNYVRNRKNTVSIFGFKQKEI